MKVISCTLILSSIALTNAWSINRRSAMSNLFKTVGSAALVTTVQPSISSAAEFTGSYSDPNHPNCKRNIVADGNKVALSGTDGTPGCPVDGSGNSWSLSGEISGENILVDFSPKGGPKNLKGEWDGSGIRWPDGNKWSKK